MIIIYFIDDTENIKLQKEYKDSKSCVGIIMVDNYEDQDTALQIHLILHELQEPYKEVFQLRVFGELSFSQIGTIFGKTENWARVTYHRARLKIKERMDEHE